MAARAHAASSLIRIQQSARFCKPSKGRSRTTAARSAHSRAHPLTSRNRGATQFSGAWSVQLRREGFHVNHFHPQGWISSAYYVSVPEEVSDVNTMSGWIKFGETRYPVPGAHAETFIKPRPGRLVLFPIYVAWDQPDSWGRASHHDRLRRCSDLLGAGKLSHPEWRAGNQTGYRWRRTNLKSAE